MTMTDTPALRFPTASDQTAAQTTPTSTISTSRTWTREMIFKEPELKWLTLPPHNTTARFTDAFLEELQRETRWKLIEEPPTLSEELREAIGTGAHPCPLCKGSKSSPLLHRGEATNIEMYRRVKCSCGLDRLFWERWQYVPKRFKHVRLETLAPRSNERISEERQAKIIAAFRAKPQDSYFMYGPPGTGKTHLATALYREAVKRSADEQFRRDDWCPSVWRISTSVLLNEHADWEGRDRNDPDCRVKAPSVTERMITSAAKKNYRPCLFLEEIDKVATSRFKLDRLCEIINAVYDAEGQVVATANKSVDSLAARWGDDEAGTVLRRIGAGEGGHTVPFEG